MSWIRSTRAPPWRSSPNDDLQRYRRVGQHRRYVRGSNLRYDLALEARDRIVNFLRQSPKEPSTLPQARQQVIDLSNWFKQVQAALEAQAKAKAAK